MVRSAGKVKSGAAGAPDRGAGVRGSGADLVEVEIAFVELGGVA